jgi:signal transduction histidine kinase
MVRQLRESHDELQHFVRALSHDMNVNLLLLQASVQELKKGLGPTPLPQVERDVALVDACLKQSRRFLNDMVELGKTGAVQVEPDRVDLQAVVDEVLFEQRAPLQEASVTVHVERPLAAVWCNADRVKQIVVNLLRNAVKHGCDRQAPRITIAAAADGADRVALRIHDNGPGIPRRYHREIFLPGRRAPGCAADGSGMGLAIVKKIADLYQGDAYVDSACAQGTAMVVTLPATKPEAPHAGKPAVQPRIHGRSAAHSGGTRLHRHRPRAAASDRSQLERD